MTSTRELRIVEPGPLATVQDLGRPGLAALGVGHSGAVDRGAHGLANRLLGNPESAATVEVTFGGLRARARGDLVVAVTGAPCPITVAGRREATNAVVRVPDGADLELGTPSVGLRSYVAVRGGIETRTTLHARATDTLAGLGPAPLASDDRLPIGAPPATPPLIEVAPVSTLAAGEVTLRVLLGPRDDWFAGTAVDRLLSEAFEVTAESDRVGMRLNGPELTRSRHGELASEGMVCGALQVPPSGHPTLFLADHPVTGGYPVIAVVASADLSRAAQARPGQRLRFTTTRGGHD